ncbi:LOW QUALITY PROTEIN: hypothetical protein CFC21_105796 [Triticum aestivum]|uniref:Uncharacterized protein n=2 Tax=Triticum aestivum TaxID=4565 RepID=A0A3B6STH4_WHEAT|nr:LOW QUALITY PROTEIN: hypothetical protein CFC21_105796 [Triticum aestivum]
MWPSLQAHIWIWSTLFHPKIIYSIPAIDSNSLFSNCTLKAKPKKDHINYSPNSRINHGIQMEDRKRRQFKSNGQRIQDRNTYSQKRITRERKQLHILLACLSDLLSNCHGSTTVHPRLTFWHFVRCVLKGLACLLTRAKTAGVN